METPSESPKMPKPECVLPNYRWNAGACADWLEAVVSSAADPNQTYSDAMSTLLGTFKVEDDGTPESLKRCKTSEAEKAGFCQVLVDEMVHRGGTEGVTGFQRKLGMEIKGTR